MAQIRDLAGRILDLNQSLLAIFYILYDGQDMLNVLSVNWCLSNLTHLDVKKNLKTNVLLK